MPLWRSKGGAADPEPILKEVQPHDLLKFGIIPELVGRLPVIAALDGLTRADLVQILTKPKNALVKQYQKLFSYDNVDLTFTEDALEAVADKAIARNIGAPGSQSRHGGYSDQCNVRHSLRPHHRASDHHR